MQISRKSPFSLYCLLAVTALAATACSRPTVPAGQAPAVASSVAVSAASTSPPPVEIPPAVSPPAVTPTAHARFGSRQVLHVGWSVTYPDGLAVVLDTINDSRCKPNVQCIWAGELAPQLTLHGAKLGAAHSISLGTSRNPKRTLAGYELALLDASTDAATLMVTKDADALPADPAPATADSGMRGVAVIGPSCPVERMPPDPNCSDKPYAATFAIDTVTGAHVATVASGADGSFSIGLAPGAYVIRLQSSAMLPRMELQPFTVTAHTQTQLRLRLDSGMR